MGEVTSSTNSLVVWWTKTQGGCRTVVPDQRNVGDLGAADVACPAFAPWSPLGSTASPNEAPPIPTKPLELLDCNESLIRQGSKEFIGLQGAIGNQML
jgi:hypothetical protein